MAAGVKVVAARVAHWIVLALVLAMVADTMVCLLAKAQGDVVNVAGGGVINEKSAGRSTYGPVYAPEPESEYDYDEDVEVEMELATARGPGGVSRQRERGGPGPNDSGMYRGQ